MPKLKNIFLFTVISFFIMGFSFSFDWVSLHEEAVSIGIEEAEQIRKKSPGSLSSLYLLALTYLENYKIDLAEGTFQEGVKIDSGNPFFRWGKIECLRRKYQCQDCEVKLSQIIEESPGFAPAYVTLAYLYYRDRDFNKTARLTYQVIRMGQDSVDEANYIRALGLFAGAKGMAAHYGGPLSKVINGRMIMPYLQRAKRIDPDSAVVKFGLGSYYLLAPAIFGKDLDKAEDYLTRAIEADPHFADIYVRLAQVYRAKGDLVKYDKYLAKAIQIDPKNDLALDIKQGICNFICVD